MLEVKAILKKNSSDAYQSVSPVSSNVTSVKRTHHQPEWMKNGHTGHNGHINGKEAKLPILYLSFDVETDGPVPGLYSMLSLGMAGFTINKELIWEREINLFPLEEASRDRKTMDFWQHPDQADAWNSLMQNRQQPSDAFIVLAKDLHELRKNYRVVPVAWPACFDWMFLQYYMYRFVGENPLGRRAKCADSYAWAISKTIHPNVPIEKLLDHWSDGRYPNGTHNCLADAKGQGARFINMLREMTKNGRDVRLIRKQ